MHQSGFWSAVGLAVLLGPVAAPAQTNETSDPAAVETIAAEDVTPQASAAAPGAIEAGPTPAAPDRAAAEDAQCDRAELFGATPPRGLEGTLEHIKNPVPWWKWGFDIRLRETYIGNGFTLDKKDPDHEWHWQRQRVRLWGTLTPVENLDFNIRVAWEGKHFDRPLSFENWKPTSTVFDRLNVKWSDIAGTGVSIQAGRQELMLGDRWLVMDGAPLVGSSFIYFDAIRLTFDLEAVDTTLDLVYLEQDAEEENWFPPIDDEDRLLLEHDETGVIARLTNRSLPQTQLDGYFIYARRTPSAPNGDQAEIYTFGARAEHRFTDRLTLRGNLAGQFGRKNEAALCALGGLSRLSYELEDGWKSALRLDYEYLSGDRPGTERNEGFDILWGRWPRFSELYLYTYGGETRIGDYTNLHRVSLGWTGHPTEKLELCSDYHLLFADQTTFEELSGFSESGCFRGQLFSTVARYRFTKHLSGHILGEYFFPGDYYTDERNDPAVFLRAELVLSF